MNAFRFGHSDGALYLNRTDSLAPCGAADVVRGTGCAKAAFEHKPAKVTSIDKRNACGTGARRTWMGALTAPTLLTRRLKPRERADVLGQRALSVGGEERLP